VASIARVEIGADRYKSPFSLLQKVSLAAEVLVTYVRVRLLLRRIDLREGVAALRSVPERARRRPEHSELDAQAAGIRLGRAIVRTLSPLPLDSRCLMCSLVLTRLLARRGIDSSLIIAVRSAPEVDFGAHAWVEHAGLPLLEPGDEELGRLVEI
jgi:hypothetical protein